MARVGGLEMSLLSARVRQEPRALGEAAGFHLSDYAVSGRSSLTNIQRCRQNHPSRWNAEIALLREPSELVAFPP